MLEVRDTGLMPEGERFERSMDSSPYEARGMTKIVIRSNGLSGSRIRLPAWILKRRLN